MLQQPPFFRKMGVVFYCAFFPKKVIHTPPPPYKEYQGKRRGNLPHFPWVRLVIRTRCAIVHGHRVKGAKNQPDNGNRDGAAWCGLSDVFAK
jgi:hypothetical protein